MLKIILYSPWHKVECSVILWPQKLDISQNLLWQKSKISVEGLSRDRPGNVIDNWWPKSVILGCLLSLVICFYLCYIHYQLLGIDYYEYRKLFYWSVADNLMVSSSRSTHIDVPSCKVQTILTWRKPRLGMWQIERSPGSALCKSQMGGESEWNVKTRCRKTLLPCLWEQASPGGYSSRHEISKEKIQTIFVKK